MGSELVIVYLGLGSNLGDREANLEKALDLLSRELSIARVSSRYDTSPVGNLNQPRFLNMVCQVRTRLSPRELLALVKSIELKMGRPSNTHNAPRSIDIDILFYGDQVIETAELVIPHPRLATRAFVLVPLAEIAPELVHPVSGQPIRELLREVPTQDVQPWGKQKTRVEK